MNYQNDLFAKIVNHLITMGFVYQNSLIYGGLANTWDYGPLGVEVKNNLKRYWWQQFIQQSPNNVGLDTAILMNKKVWFASGHLNAFNDPLIECKNCHTRYRADEMIAQQAQPFVNEIKKMSLSELNTFISKHDFQCIKCKEKNNFTSIKQFNMMFKTTFGAVNDQQNDVYLRPETAQGIFVNFKNVLRSSRKKLPFGIGNIGKSFRNEITLGNFLFRTREFEQLELEFFCQPGTDNYWWHFWQDKCWQFIKNLHVNENKLRYRQHEKNELAFYAKETVDLEYCFPTLGWSEIAGIANRTDYDLKQHEQFSHESLKYVDEEKKTSYWPYCIEPSIGLDRLLLTVLIDSYQEEVLSTGDIRIIMHLAPFLAPYQVIVLPLSKKLVIQAQEIYKLLTKNFMTFYDETGSIGKRYRRADAIGIPFAVTIDFDTLQDNKVTVRERDSMQQQRIKIDTLINYLQQQIKI